MPAVLAEWVAIGKVIQAGAAPPMGILSVDRFYHDGDVPPSAPPGYFLFGQEGEGNGGFVNQPGDSATLRIHCWARSKMQAGRLYEWFHGLVNDQRLTLDGHHAWSCRVRRIPGGPGPDGESYQAIAEVEMETIRG